MTDYRDCTLFKFAYYITVPDIPHYSLANLGAPSAQAGSPMSLPTPGYGSSQPMDMNSTITSQTSLSGGKMQYTPPVSQAQQTPGQSQIQLQQQLISMLAANLLMQQQQSSQQTSMPSQMPNSQVDQTEQLKSMQTMLSMLASQGGMAASGQQSNVLVAGSDPNMNPQNVDMSSLGSMDPSMLEALINQVGGDSPMVSFSSLDALTGNPNELNYDPNVAGFETVGDSSQGSQQQYDETAAAVQNI